MSLYIESGLERRDSMQSIAAANNNRDHTRGSDIRKHVTDELTTVKLKQIKLSVDYLLY